MRGPSPDQRHPSTVSTKTASSQTVQSHNVSNEKCDGSGSTPSATHESRLPPVGQNTCPDGGLRAWFQVMSSFFVLFNTLGNAQSFGTYQTFYESGTLFTASSADIAWIGSLQTSLMHFVGALTGPLYDAGYFYHLLAISTTLIVVGTMTLSLCTTYWQVILAQGVCVGLGQGFGFVPSVAVLASHFKFRLATANGIASAGSSIGAIIMTIAFHRLQPSVGFPWAVRVQGFIQLATLLISLSTMRAGVLPGKIRRLVDWSAFREPGWVIYVLGFIVGIMGVFVPFYYVQYFVIQTNVSDPNFAFYILSIINASAVFGRVLPGLVADKIGPLNTVIPCIWITSALVFCLLAVKSVAGIVPVTIFYGFFQAPFLALYAPAIAAMSPSLELIGTRTGMTLALAGIGQLIGPPIAGFIVGRIQFDYLWIYSGVCCVASGCLYALTRGINSRWTLKTRM